VKKVDGATHRPVWPSPHHTADASNNNKQPATMNAAFASPIIGAIGAHRRP